MPPTMQLPVAEPERLAALRSYDVLDTPPEPSFDSITKMASQIFAAPISLITLLDEERQFFKSRIGLDFTETPRQIAFCSHAILQDRPLIVPDATKDARFSDNPGVTGHPYVRFYAGATLKTKLGFRLGTLCVLDTKPRRGLTPEQIDILEGLAAQVIELLELKLQQKRLETLSSVMQGAKKLLEAGEKQRTRSEQMAKLALDAGHLGVWEWDMVQGKGYWSERMAQLMGLAPDHPCPTFRQGLKCISPAHRRPLLAQIRRPLASREPIRVKFRLQHSDGKGRWISLMGNHFIDQRGNWLRTMGVAWDSSASDNHLEELAAAKELAEMASNAKETLLTNVSHELRTPLNGILGMTDLLLQTGLTEEQHEIAQMVHESGVSLLNLVSEMLDMTLIEACKLPVVQQPFCWKTMLDRVVSQVRPEADRKGIELTVIQSSLPGARFLGDEERIRQILEVYLRNALKFTRAGSVTVKVAMQKLSNIQPGTAEHYEVLAMVRDTGPGIPLESQSKLFQPFSQVDSSTTRRHNGVGLGLALARRLAELIGGSVGMVSTAGSGATFWLKLTLQGAAPDARPDTLPEPAVRTMLA